MSNNSVCYLARVSTPDHFLCIYCVTDNYLKHRCHFYIVVVIVVVVGVVVVVVVVFVDVFGFVSFDAVIIFMAWIKKIITF